MPILKINNQTIIPVTVPTPYPVGDVNMYLAEEGSGTGLALIDAAVNTDDAWELLMRSLTEAGYALKDIRRILITHHHVDHVGLIDRIVSQTAVPVYVHPDAIPRMKRDAEFLAKRIEFFRQLYQESGCGQAGERQIDDLRRKLHDNAHLKVQADLLPVTEGNREGLAGYQALETPGHAPDHLVYLDNTHRVMFSGDHVLPHISSNALVEPDALGRRMPTLVKYRDMLRKCLVLQADLVFPGHGEPFKELQPLIRRRLERIDDKAERLERLMKDAPKTAFQLAETMYPKEVERQFSLVMSEVIGLLDYLEASGRAAKEMDRGVWRYFSVQIG
ncbi:MBL fold metallo-hydrolase [Ferviditalea candida]|uniref:MBL fold metallo-hydrolase n=1 Tax=Ferviditalea candida TaxID=3108399 RepID=A0ABU5ZHI4_9BACL|nr:MBL fold metallo-hydrolase [Paenibacillaceae bacterium T2]